MAGLVARAIEDSGVPTIAISISRTITEQVRPPRAVVVRFPFGHALGLRDDVAGQRRVLLEALHLLVTAREPEIRELSHLRWKRTDYSTLPPVAFPNGHTWR